MANIRNNLLGSNQVVPGNATDSDDELSKIKIPDRIWIAYFENMMKITEKKKADYDLIRSRNADESRAAEYVEPIQPENSDRSNSEEDESEDFEIPITGRPRIELVGFPEVSRLL